MPARIVAWCALAALSLLLSQVPARAAATATITGSVQGTGATLGGISVQVQGGAGESWTATTDDAGNFSVTGITPGTRFVYFSDPQGRWVSQPYLDGSYSQAISVADGATVQLIPTTLQLAGQVKGQLTGATGVPAGLVVQAHNEQTGRTGALVTASDGTFVIGGLAPGPYTLRITDQAKVWADSCFHLSGDYLSCDLLTVTAGQVLDVGSYAMAHTGSISGQAVGTGASLGGISVSVYRNNVPLAIAAQTDSLGHFSVSGLAPGSYTIGLLDYGNRWMPNWYNGHRYQTQADPIAVADGQNVDLGSVQMSRYATVTGTVKAGGAPLSFAYVELLSPDLTAIAYNTTTDSQGHYTFSGVIPGQYHLYVYASVAGWVPQWDDGQLLPGTALTIAEGAQDLGVTDLPPGATISGTVTGAGTPLARAEVKAFPAADNYSATSALSGWATTDAAGHFAISGLAAGTYKLCLDQHSAGYQLRCFGGTPTLDGATEVPVAVGATVDAGSLDLPQTGWIVGHVDTDGAPQILEVELWDSTGSTLITTTWVGADGSYDLVDVPTGDYRVSFANRDPSKWGAIWYGAVHDRSKSALVHVDFGSTTTLNPQHVDKAATIAGTLMQDGRPFSGAYIDAYIDGVVVSRSGTDQYGDYVVTSLPPGDVHLRFYSPTSAFTPFNYGGSLNDSRTDKVISVIADEHVLFQPFNVNSPRPVVKPGPPLAPRVVIHGNSARVSWSPVKYAGSASVASYTAQAFTRPVGGSVAATCKSAGVHGSDPPRSCALSKLKVGTYYVQVIAKDSDGGSSNPSVRVKVRIKAKGA